MENTMDLVLLADKEGTVRYVSPSVTGFLNFPAEEVVGKKYWEFIHPDDRKSVLEGIPEIIAGNRRSLSLRSRLMPSSGEPVWTECKVVYWKGEAGDGTLVFGFHNIAEDISYREYVRHLERASQLLLENTDQSIVLIDTLYRIITFNRRAYLEAQRNRGVHLRQGDNILDLTDPEKRPVLESYIREILSGRSKVLTLQYSGEAEENKRYYQLKFIPAYDGQGIMAGVSLISTDITETRLAQDRIAANEQRFRSIIEQFPHPVVTYSPDGSCTGANAAWEKLWEAGKENLEGYNLLVDAQLMMPEALEAITKAFGGEVAVSRPFLYDPALENKKGRKRWIQLVLYPLKNTAGDLLEVILTQLDITPFKEAEDKIKASEMRFRSIIENSLDGIILLDAERKPLYYSSSIRTMLEYEPDELMTIDPLELIHPDDRPYVETIIEKLQPHPGETESATYRVKHRNGSWRWMFSHITNRLKEPYIAGIVFNYRDVTDQLESENKLDISRLHLSALQAVSGVGSWELELADPDPAKNTLTWSDETYRIFGFEPGGVEVSYDLFMSMVLPEDRAAIENTLETAIAKQTIYGVEHRIIRKDGSERFLFERGEMICDDKTGKPIRMIGTCQDITEQKITNLRLISLNESLARRAIELSLSNAELEKFAYVASHDLQEPLRMVSSFLQLLKKKYKDNLDDTANQYIDFAVEGAERMKMLILDLLQYSRINNSKEDVAEVPLNDVFADIKRVFSLEVAATGATITTDDLPAVMAVRSHMLQLFQNLVGNALKYRSDVPPAIHVGVEDKGDHWLFSVSDNGIGIDPKYAEKIFVIFQRLHNRHKYSGTGIGLAICKKIAEKYGGRIWIEPNEPKGSVFYVRLKK